MFIQPDFSEAQDITPIPPGTYNARITGVGSKESKKGDMYLRWELEIFGSDNSKLNNRKFWYNTMVSGPGAGGLKRLLGAVGLAAETGTQFDTEALLGKEVRVTLAEGKDQHGNVSIYPEVKSVAKLAA